VAKWPKVNDTEVKASTRNVRLYKRPRLETQPVQTRCSLVEESRQNNVGRNEVHYKHKLIIEHRPDNRVRLGKRWKKYVPVQKRQEDGYGKLTSTRLLLLLWR